MSLRRLVAALLVVTAGLGAGLTVGAPVAVASGGYCTGAGVNVVVDFTGQGGGIERGCAVHGGGGNAWDAFQAAGFPLTGVQRYPGAVCRVSGRPADMSCQGMPPADAYWGFFTSQGTGWSYASVGPTSYRVLDGDTVGFAWQTGAHRAPGAAPAARHTSPTPHATPTPAPSRQPSSPPSSHAGAGTHRGGAAPAPHHAPSRPATPTPTAADPSAASAAGRPVRRHHVAAPAAGSSAAPSGTPAPTASADVTARADAASTAPVAATPAATTSHGVPWWVPVLVLVVLAGAGTAFAWRRRTAVR